MLAVFKFVIVHGNFFCVQHDHSSVTQAFICQGICQEVCEEPICNLIGYHFNEQRHCLKYAATT